jgi:hypothetical protein
LGIKLWQFEVKFTWPGTFSLKSESSMYVCMYGWVGWMNGWMRRSEVKSGGNDRLYHLGQGRRKEGLWNSEEQFFVGLFITSIVGVFLLLPISSSL